MPWLLAQLASGGLSVLGSYIAKWGVARVEEKFGVKLPQEGETINWQQLSDIQRMIMADDYTESRNFNAALAKDTAQSWLVRHTPSLIAFVVVVGGGVMMLLAPSDIRMAVVPLVSMVVSYYFGSSSSSKSKDDTIAGQLPGTPPAVRDVDNRSNLPN